MNREDRKKWSQEISKAGRAEAARKRTDRRVAADAALELARDPTAPFADRLEALKSFERLSTVRRSMTKRQREKRYMANRRLRQKKCLAELLARE